jgi:uncharacterized protein (AIM24 family)
MSADEQQAPAGWYPDSEAGYERYWDGSTWTDDRRAVAQPGGGGVKGLDEFAEVQATETFTLQNGKLLKVSLGGATVQAKVGSMVAYQGSVTFEHAGSGGMSRMVKKAMTGEGATLMKVSGGGEVFLADSAQDIHLIRLENDKITCNGSNVLAFESGVDWDIERLQGASGMLSGGLFNLALQGTGWVALLSDGPPVRLDVGSAPTFADAQAAITWSSGVTSSVRTDFKLKDLIGKSSGETVQLAFQGSGWVLVQPSEGVVSGGGGGGEAGSGGAAGALGSLLRG